MARTMRLLAVLTLVMAAFAALSAAPAVALPNEDCAFPKGNRATSPPKPTLLTATLSADRTSATFSNLSAGCTFEVGFASYQVFFPRGSSLYLTTQQLFDAATATLGPGATLTLTVDLPDCMAQVDAFYGPVLATLPGYGKRLLTSAVVGTELCVQSGRMTGGGSVFTAGGVRVTHGFEIRCDAADVRQNLEINWEGNQFHLLDMTSAICVDDRAIAPQPPAAGFDTYIGTGTGRYNGVEGATIRFTFTDAGEPGTRDTAKLVIKDASGAIVLSVAKKVLTFGNHQAHKQ